MRKCIPTTLPGRPVRTASSVARQRGGVRREDDLGAADPVELGEDLRLEVEAFGNRLDDAIHLGQIGRRRGGDPAEQLRGAILRQPPALDGPRSRRLQVVRPRCTASSSTSAAITCNPLRANTSMLQAPMTPRPTTPTVRNSRATRLPPAIPGTLRRILPSRSTRRTARATGNTLPDQVSGRPARRRAH